MKKPTSADGTSIAYDTAGAGPGLILIAGAFTDRSYYEPLAAALSSSFAVTRYDRRGRGDGTDASQYELSREIGSGAGSLSGAPASVHCCRKSGAAAELFMVAPETLKPALTAFFAKAGC